MIPFSIEEQLEHPNNSLYLIEASAGTGKTYTIANLYLRHILDGKSVSQILVVTFTNAATDELRGRIREKLYSVLQDIQKDTASDDEFTRELLARHDPAKSEAHLNLAVRSMDEAAIFTIHGFCQRALKEFAFLSGQSFNLEFNTDEDELLLPIAKDWWRRTIYQADKLTYHVSKRAWPEGVHEFYRQIKTFLAREVEIIPEAGESLDLQPLSKTLKADYLASRDIIHQQLSESKSLLRAKGNSYYHKDNLSLAFETIDEWIEENDEAIPPDALQAFTSHYLLSKKNKSKQPLPKHDFFEQCDVYWQQYQTQCQQILTSLIQSAVDFFTVQGDDVKAEKQTLSFNDLLIQFNKALSSQSGEQLRKALQQRYPVAMIDEFQDTDPVQYGIFKQLYVGQVQQTLYMIGDPKQAIYSFRGGDIYTYLQAKNDVKDYNGTLYTLATNWRSTPDMLNAVNTLFGQATNPFIYDEIKFQAVSSPESKIDHKILTIHGKPVTPLDFWITPDGRTLKNGKTNPLSKTQARIEIDAAVAQRIAELIKLGETGDAMLGDKALQPKDIAVLVPSHSDAQRLRKQLSEVNVSSVTAGKQTVFESDEASELSLLLQAVFRTDDRDLLRQALASQLLAYSYVEIHNILNNDRLWIEWVEGFRRLHEQWNQEGFMSMFLSLLEHLNIAKTLAKQDDTDRIMTNLLQLGELLQQASKEQLGIESLLTWFEAKRQNPLGEEAELRLENDDELVKLVTLHASKGLEYGVVFLPYLWSLRVNSEDDRPIIFHDDNQQLIADTGSDSIQEHFLLADRERLAEHTRLVYVALTRAVANCVIAWGNIGSHKGSCSNNSALGYLLHGHQTAENLKKEKISSLAFSTSSEIKEQLETLATHSNETMSITMLPSLSIEGTKQATESLPNQSNLQSKTFSRSLANSWRITSFSALASKIHHRNIHSEPKEHDPILNFPAGRNTGLYLHSLFEHLDFQGDITSQVDKLNQQLMPRYGISHEDHNITTQHWVEQITQTPLLQNSDNVNLRLADIPQSKRFNELEFHFSTGNNNVNIRMLDKLLHQQTELSLQTLKHSDFHGLVNGVIDLVFEHNGKYYLADYKSNYIGDSLDDYQTSGMQTEINDRRYDLQSALYMIALHRFLQNRLINYRYDQHFGGVYYLFLRGMRTSGQTGVYFRRPDSLWLEELDACFIK